MSRHRDLELRIRGLQDIREIMGAMKNLALMESHRLARFMGMQRRVVATLESAADDFSRFYPELFPSEEAARDVCILIGSERGFCGDFNESLVKAFDAQGAGKPAGAVVVGGKLESRLGSDPRIGASIPGASVVEEVDGVLSTLVTTLGRLNRPETASGYLRLTVFHHDPDEDAVRISLLKPFRQPKATAGFVWPPLLNLPPESFLTGLAAEYLEALLHELLYRSLMAENQRRMQHMDSAVRLLERTTEDLWRRRNIARQEEITEEIEVIMLSVEAGG